MNEIYNLPNYNPSKVPKHIKIAYITRGINGVGGIGTDTSKNLWDGIYSTAKEEGIELLAFVGGHDVTEINNYIYDLVNDDLVDGIITWANSKVEEAIKLLSKFKNTPIISLSVDVKDYPVVTIDNKSGMESIVTHLITKHKIDKIAFVQGPVLHAYAIERLEAYADTLARFNIPFNKKLISESNEWNKKTGIEAVKLFLDERGLIPGRDFEAIVCVNDRIAIGVMGALESRGYSCPRDVVVTGFNNLDEARSHSPSITSVAMPFYDQAKYSVKLLKKLIQTGSVQRVNKLSSISIIHESCGCPNKWTNNEFPESFNNLSIEETVNKLIENKSGLIEDLNKPENYIEFLIKSNDSNDLIDSFISSIKHFRPDIMLEGIKRLLKNNKDIPLDLYQWQTLFSFYRNKIYSITNNKQVLLLCENILGSSLGLIMDLNIKAGSVKQMDSIVQAENLQRIDRYLSETLDLDSVIDALGEILPQTGIPSFFLVLFDRNEVNFIRDLPDDAYLRLAYYNSQRLNLPDIGIKFKTKDIVPKELPYKESVTTYLFRALSFRDEKLGYLIFEMGPEGGNIYESITQKLADSIKSAQLAEDLKTNSVLMHRTNQKLVEQQYILDTFIETVPDLIHFKDNDGRITKTNSSFLEKFQLKNSNEVIGRKSVDLFPREQRENILKYEKDIIYNNKKFLNVNEKFKFSSEDEWFMTTRMPLYDYLGKINGMFEISRDITDLKSVNDNLQESINELKITQKHLVEAEKMAALGELVVGVAHEINTPLGICITGISFLDMQLKEFLIQKKLCESVSEYETDETYKNIFDSVDIISRNLTKVTKLINNFKQISSENSIVDISNIKLHEYFNNLITALHQTISGSFNVKVKCDESLYIVTFPETLEIIFTHLIKNTLEHGYDISESAEINIDIFRDFENITIIYKDAGRGADKTTIEKIFNPFYTTKRGLGSSGLGMHIVYNLVQKTLKGKIKCSSNIGHGILFTMTLPLDISNI